MQTCYRLLFVHVATVECQPYKPGGSAPDQTFGLHYIYIVMHEENINKQN